MNPVDWADEYAATMDDAPSLRNMRSILVDRLASDAAIRKPLKRAAKKEWDAARGDLKVERERALGLIDARMRELKIKPHRSDELKGYRLK